MYRTPTLMQRPAIPTEVSKYSIPLVAKRSHRRLERLAGKLD